jgi:hypothetical protein
MENCDLLGILVAIVCVIIMLALFRTVRSYEQYMIGFWTADPIFLAKSGLSDMIVLVTEDKKTNTFGRNLTGYMIIIDNEGEYIANQKFTISYSIFRSFSAGIKGALANIFGCPTQKYGLKSVCLETQEPIMPRKINITCSMDGGYMVLWHGKQIYAYLYKDHAMSNS